MPRSNLVRDRTHEKALSLSGNIQKYMRCRNKTASDVARAAGITLGTWYKKMQNPEAFKYAEVVRVVCYLDFSQSDREELL